VMMERPRKSAKVILFPDAREYDQAKARKT